ncbi:hypothetical protein ILYODFUR_000991 [Ilyodon furcidens]|uniref:Uncharacterized protein n=1 Tax=Ilyodon furcidens TaxID=33524 RepID=A0ABV0TFA2_9TELE
MVVRGRAEHHFNQTGFFLFASGSRGSWCLSRAVIGREARSGSAWPLDVAVGNLRSDLFFVWRLAGRRSFRSVFCSAAVE